MRVYSTIIQDVSTRKVDNIDGVNIEITTDLVKLTPKQRSKWMTTAEFSKQELNVKNLDFGTALLYLKDNFRVRRASWSSENNWLIIINRQEGVKLENYGAVDLTEAIAFKDSSERKLIMGWIPTHEDILANDWEIFNSKKKA